MNKYDTIRQLADGNSKRFRPQRMEEVQDQKIPFFCIKRSAIDGYSIDMYGYERHDNAPRMPHYCNFILKHVLPNLAPEHDVTGAYQIELHDTYSYLNNDKNYDNALVFAKDMDDRLPCLVPDPYMIDNYGGRLSLIDPYEHHAKQDKIVFAGVTTGDMDPSKNERLRLVDWSCKHRDFTDFKITKVVQMREDAIRNVYSNIYDMIGAPLSQQAQYSYKYIMNIDGNTACWDRFMWIMNSKSLAMKYASKQMLWYYPLIQENIHYIGVDLKTIQNQFMFYKSNVDQSKWMVSNANAFARDYANHLAALMYTTRLFENFAMNK